MPHDSQATATFRHEHCPVWKEGDRPRLLQPFGDDDNPEIPFLSRFEVDASVRQGGWLPDDGPGARQCCSVHEERASVSVPVERGSPRVRPLQQRGRFPTAAATALRISSRCLIKTVAIRSPFTAGVLRDFVQRRPCSKPIEDNPMGGQSQITPLPNLTRTRGSDMLL